MQSKTCRLGTYLLLVLGLLSCGCASSSRRDTALARSAAGRQRPEFGPDRVIQPVSHEEEIDQDLTLGDFAPAKISKTVKRLTGNGPVPAAAKEAYSEADNLYRAAVQQQRQNPQADLAAQFLAAAEKYREAADRWPDSTLEHDALFMLGECQFFADHYPEAEDSFAELLKKYSNSKHLDRIQPRRFAMAEYWLSLDDSDRQQFHELNWSDKTRPRHDTFGHAIRVFERIRLDDPTGKLADDATLALGNAFFSRAKFLRADEYYTDLRKTFPSSEHQFRAHFLGLKTKLLSYQGPDYSANPLLEAEKLLKQIRRQFPAEAETEREYLNRAHAEARYRLAEREWELAAHHDRRSEYGAAKFYYQTLLADFDDTPFAQRSEQRLREIGGLPELPPQRLSWLVDLFPENETAQPAFSTSSQTHTR